MANGGGGELEASGGSAPVFDGRGGSGELGASGDSAPALPRPAGSDDNDDGEGGSLATTRSKKGPSSSTATLETEMEFDHDARAIRKRQLKQAHESLKKNPSGASVSASGEVYKGIHGYTDYKAGFRREHMVSSGEGRRRTSMMRRRCPLPASFAGSHSMIQWSPNASTTFVNIAV